MLTALVGLLAHVDMPARLLAGKPKSPQSLLNKLLRYLSSDCAGGPSTLCGPGKVALHTLPNMPHLLLQRPSTMY